jgi:sugar phosphate isomerase/epimerase
MSGISSKNSFMKITAYAHSQDAFGELKSKGFEHVALHPMLFPGIEMGMIPNEETIEAVNAQLRKHNLEPTDLVTFNAWNALGLSGAMEQLPSSPSDPEYEMARKRGVAQFTKLIKICKRFGAKQIYSQLGGRPLYHLDHEEAWTKSVRDLDPILEEEGIHLAFMPHPGDFIEESDPCVDLIQKSGCKNVKYIFVAPHTFVLAGKMQANPGAMIKYASRAGLLSEVHMADSIKPVQAWIRDHLDISAIHSHLVPGKGFVDIEGILRALFEVDFNGPMIMIPYRYGISDKSFIELASESKDYVERILNRIC